MTLWNSQTTGPLACLTMLSAARGWIGVDIGTSTVKLAQVQRRGDHWQIVQRWLLPYDGGLLTKDSVSRGEMASLLAHIQRTRRTFRGRTAAVSLSMSLADLRMMELPRGEHHEMVSMIREELLCDPAGPEGEANFDFWETATDVNKSDDMARVAVVGAATNAIHQVCALLARGGLECQVLDGVPCALARAVEMAAPAQAGELAVALDLGYQSSSLSLIAGGRPVFSRVLRNCGISHLMQALRKEWQLSDEECRHLLINYGVAGSSDEGEHASIASATARLVAAPLHEFLAEVQRTLSYLSQLLRGRTVQHMWLFGGGATIRQLPELLHDKTQLAVSPWSLPGNEHSIAQPADAVFGIAAALSAVAWEARTCT